MLGSHIQAVFFYIYIYIINRPSGAERGTETGLGSGQGPEGAKRWSDRSQWDRA